jgi:ribosomal protein L37AE/L43A
MSDEERTARIARLRDEIERLIEQEYAFAVKYRELAASFEALMPQPEKRHDAVLLALSTTMKREPREIGAAVTSQQEELALLEQAVAELFAKLSAKNRGHEASAPAQTSMPKHCSKCGAPLSLDPYENRWKCRSCAHEVEQGNTIIELEQETPAAAAAETDLQKKCPQCGGVMHYHVHHKLWQCYTCAHEEEMSEIVEQTDMASATAPAGSQDDIIPGTVAISGTWAYQKPAAKTRACPVCRKKMDWYEQEKRWKCFFCGHKMR